MHLCTNAGRENRCRFDRDSRNRRWARGDQDQAAGRTQRRPAPQ